MATREKGDNNAEKDEQASSKGLSKEKYNKPSKNKKKSLILRGDPKKKMKLIQTVMGKHFV